MADQIMLDLTAQQIMLHLTASIALCHEWHCSSLTI